MEFKKLSAVDAVETVSDAASVLIEENGVIKKTSTSNIGTVKSVNGAEPDENGNVDIEIATSWNDLTDKPFYEEEGLVSILAETTLEFTAGSNTTIDEIDFVEGDTYIVTWDGVEYSCVPWTYSGWYIGNQTLHPASLTTDTGEPFMFSNSGWARAATSGTHTFKIEKADTVVHKLDTKYLPDWDAIITSTGTPSAVGNDIMSLTLWDFNALKEMIIGGKMPNILITHNYTYGNTYTSHTIANNVQYDHTNDSIAVIYVPFLFGYDSPWFVAIRVASDGSITVAKSNSI